MHQTFVLSPFPHHLGVLLSPDWRVIIALLTQVGDVGVNFTFVNIAIKSHRVYPPKLL